MGIKISSLLILALIFTYSCESSHSENRKLVQYEGKRMDSIILKDRCLVVFQFDTKDVKCLNKEFNIKNKDGLLFSLSGQSGIQINRGFVFTKGSDTMYIAMGGGFSHDLIKMKKFIPGYYSYLPNKISLFPDIVFGRSFITDERVREIPVLYDDYRGGRTIRNLGETDFSVTEVSSRNLHEVNRLIIESIKEEVRNL